MPRQDVPYGGAICRLKERIAEIWDKLGEKLHSINGVEGDGQGNVTIKSGDPAVVINNDQAQHEIVLDLDTSQLPAADVNSVNGQTGVVVLDGDDLDGVTPGNSVNDDITALQGADSTLQGNINAEALARQNADSTLQTNINTATAAIPTEVSNQIAADNTIVRTSGNQNISGVKTVATQATGSYSQQIANSQKVRNELDNYATMVRTANNQTIGGVKTFTSQDIHTNGVVVSRSYDGYIHKEPTNKFSQGITWSRRIILYQDADGINVCYLQGTGKSDGTGSLTLYVRNSDGTYKSIILLAGDII